MEVASPLKKTGKLGAMKEGGGVIKLNWGIEGVGAERGIFTFTKLERKINRIERGTKVILESLLFLAAKRPLHEACPSVCPT